ncbi:MAG: FAD-binding monooxygenase [Betaproteobacteria bacterium]|nr:FAD-binding monooxygenase [Betaproteobacteria bacterium]
MTEQGKIYDVAVVGFGPSGAVAAGLLGGLGLSTYVCDRAREVYDKPRAVALDHEIMRVFQQLGVVQKILPHIEPFTDSCYYGVQGQLIRRMSTVAPPYPLGYHPSLVFTQPPVEAILRQHAQGLPTVKVELGTAVTGLAQDDTGATLQLRGDDGITRGSERSVRARYVIACDGASSTVRELAGLRLEDLGFDEPWLVVDVQVNPQGLAKLPRESVQYCEPARPSSFIIGPGNHRRWEISINPGEDPKELATPEGTWRLLSRWITPEDAVLWRQASYRFHALVADQWRAGRVFVAGDAAHQQPPFLGQGMCQGVRDVANLAWKLEAVLRGDAPEALLDSYGAERKGHVTALTTRIKHVGQLIGERDVARARERDARLLSECGGVVRATPRQEVQPALAHGLIDARAHAANGTLFPQPWILHDGAPRRMDELAGTGWRLVLRDRAALAFPAGALPAGTRILHLGAPAFTETECVLAAWFARHECFAALVRPDHYVYGVAADAAQLGAMLGRLAPRIKP